jgi:tetrahydromethanopterin S-methyltransferase subunit B
MEQIQQKLIEIEVLMDAINKELLNLSPDITAKNEETAQLNKSLIENLNTLKELIVSREQNLNSFLHALDPYFLTIDQYKGIAPAIENIIHESIDKLEIKRNSLMESISIIPEKTLVITKHTLDYKSLSVLSFFSLLFCGILFCFGQIWILNKNLDQSKSFEVKYRMLNLEYPLVANNLDSLYRRNPEKVEETVIKKEEEQRLRWSIKEKQREIRELQRD